MFIFDPVDRLIVDVSQGADGTPLRNEDDEERRQDDEERRARVQDTSPLHLLAQQHESDEKSDERDEQVQRALNSHGESIAQSPGVLARNSCGYCSAEISSPSSAPQASTRTRPVGSRSTA